jgi:hypothetical protein
MPGNGGKFKLEHDDNRLGPSLRAQRSNPELQRKIGLLRCARNDGMPQPYFLSASATACQIWSLISVAGGLGMTAAGPVRFWHAATSRRIHTSPSV